MTAVQNGEGWSDRDENWKESCRFWRRWRYWSRQGIHSAQVFIVRRYASAVYAVVICLAVSLSVTSQSSTKTAKRRITQTTLYDSP